MNDTTSRRTTILIAITILGTVLAIVALAVAVTAIGKDQTDSKRIGALQAQLHAAAPTLSSASNGVIAEQTKLKTLESRIAKLAPQLAAIESCLPELQSELSDLEIKGETYALSYISNSAHTSLACNKILYASGR
jgi:septal ring factor EnvC (AmiA/AmiB activator)